jgi:hypothetical protein
MSGIEGRTTDLSHLLPAVQEAALLPDEERKTRIRADRWIAYPRAMAALAELEDLFAWPRRQRMQNLLLIGPTNNGKSMILEKFRRAHPPRPSDDQETEIIPVVVMQMPSDPTVSRFYQMLLFALNAPVARTGRRLQDVETLSLNILRRTQVKVLVIDELHNMLAGSPSLQRQFLNLIRFLGNELHIPIIGAGIAEAYRAIRSDDQLESRFKPFILPRWENMEEVSALLASFAKSFPLRRVSNLGGPEMASYVAARTEGTIGEIATLMTRAAIVAIETGEEALNQRTVSLADYESPTERRRRFEREIAG